MEQKQSKKIMISLLILAAVTAVMVIGYRFLKPQPVKGEKSVQITVVSEDQTEKEYDVQTDAEFLQQVMDEAEGLTYSGTEGEYGLMIEKVNDEIAAYDENGAYWAFYLDDEYCSYGIGEQPAADGDEFRIVFTSGE